MYENGIFQIWHKKSKNDKWYTAIVSVDRFGKLQFVFEEPHIMLCLSMCRRELENQGYNLRSLYDVFTLEEEFIYDIENNKILKGGGKA